MGKMAPRHSGESGCWRLKPAWAEREAFARQLRVPPLVAQLLYNRGVRQLEAARRFMQPTLKDLIDPAELGGMADAIGRIRQAMTRGEKIVLYGDYDVDGIAGVSILWHCLRLAGVEAEYYVPHRLDEGYGVNAEAVRQLASQGAKLIVTVDCGVGAQDSAALARELGVDMVVTDHHQLNGALPEVAAVVHPDLPGSSYGNKDLCGAGVAFKLAWGLAQSLSPSQRVEADFREFLVSATGLAALGTVADVSPLTGENRSLAYHGLAGLEASTNVGIRALIEAAGLGGAKLDSFDIGFKLAPRLNAAGRMGHARLAVELFTRSGPARAQEIASYLETQNRQRQKVEKELTATAMEQVKALGMDKEGWRGIVVAGEQWHGGVIGIVASRLVDRYYRPTVVISRQAGESMGSCRSIEGFDMCEALGACKEHLSSFGGHTMAAGLRLESKQIEAFREAFNCEARARLDEESLQRCIDVDAEVALADLSRAAVEVIERLGPFGAGNPKVRLAARRLCLAGPCRRMGQRGDHLQFLVAGKDDTTAHLRPGGVLRAVAFGKAKWEKVLADADHFDVVFQPVINRFKGNTTVEMIVEDLQVGQ